MAVKVAINGFGRIGRNVLRAIYESGRTDIEVVAIEGQRPILRLSGTARAFAEAAGVELAVSISHEGDIATAVVVATRCCSSHGSAHA